MAALGTIRKRGALLIFIIGLGLFGFIAGDVFRSCETQTNEARMQVGEVLGKKISQPEFLALVDETMTVYKMQGMDNLTEEQTNALRDQVWQQYVSVQVLNAECEKLGLTVTDEELQNVIKEGNHQILANTPFVNPNTNRFDVAILQNFLDAYKSQAVSEQDQMIYTYWKYVEKSLRQDILANKYNALLANCMLSNPVSAQAAFDARNIDSQILLAAVPYTSLAGDSIKATNSEVEALYNKDKKKYEVDAELRSIKYVTQLVTASPADRDALLKTANEVAEQFKAGDDLAVVLRKANSKYTYNALPMLKSIYSNDIVAAIDTLKVGQVSAPFETVADNTYNVVKLVAKTQLPDSVQFRLIQVGGATAEAAKTTADSIVTAIKAGANFDTLAVKYNYQVATKQWLTANDYSTTQIINADNKKFFETIITSSVNDVKALALPTTAFVIEVLDRRAMSDKYEVAVMKTEIAFSNETYNTAYNNFSRFVSESKTIEDLEKNAAKYGYTVLEQNDVPNTIHNVAGIKGTSDVVRWMFNEAEVGQIIPLKECGDNNQLLVVALTDVVEKGYAPLDKVKEVLTAEVLEEKNFNAAKAKFDGATDIAAAVAKGISVDTISHVTFSAPMFLPSVGGQELSLSGAVAGIEEGKTSSIIKGQNGAYMFQVIARGPRSTQAFDTANEEKTLQTVNWNTVSRFFIYELIQNAEIVDNRYLFF